MGDGEGVPLPGGSGSGSGVEPARVESMFALRAMAAGMESA